MPPTEHPEYAFVGLSIEGIGTEGTVSSPESDGWLMVTQGAVQHHDTIENVESQWTPKYWLDIDRIGGTDTLIELFRGSTRWSGFDVSVQAEDEAAERLLYTQRRAKATTSTIRVGDSSVNLGESGFDDQVIYVDDETIVLGSDLGSGLYNVQQRGAYGSIEGFHKDGANVFTATPYWEGRRVKLYTAEYLEKSPSSGREVEYTLRWLGSLGGNIVQDRGRIQLAIGEAPSSIKNLSGGRASRRIEGVSATVYIAGENSGRVTAFDDDFTADARSKEYVPKIVKANAVPSDAAGNPTTAFQINDSDYAVASSDLPIDTSGTDTYKGGFTAQDGLWDRELTEATELEEQGQTEVDLHEVFAADRSLGVTPLHEIENVTGITDIKWHPLAYYGAIMLSTPGQTANPGEFDVLQPDWSCNAEWLYEDSIVSTLKTLMRRYPKKIDRVGGWGMDGETVDLREMARKKFLQAYGFTEGVTKNGRLTVHRVRTPTIEDFNTAQNRKVRAQPSEVLQYDTGEASTVEAIEVNVGSGPMTEGQTLFVVAQDDSNVRRSGSVTKDPDIQIDRSTASPDNLDEVRRETVQNVLLQVFGIPRLTIKVSDWREGSLEYGLGEVVNPTDLEVEPDWLVDQTGSRTGSQAGREDFTGFLVGRKFFVADKTRSLSYTLTMMLFGAVVRWRAPSGIIQSTSTSSGNRILGLGGSGGGNSAFGQTDASAGGEKKDAGLFTIGDEVQIYDKDGTDHSDTTPKEIVDVRTSGSNNEIEVSGDWLTAPSAGQIVRLAHLDSDGSGTGYQNDGLNGRFSNVDRVYAYLAESDDTLGDADLSNDEYGAG